MSFESHLTAWRTYGGLSQADLAQRTGLTRAYLSRLESGRADPSLSTLAQLSRGLGTTIGALIETLPPVEEKDRFHLDQMARAALRPSALKGNLPLARSLAWAFQPKRAALGLFKGRSEKGASNDVNRTITLRRLRARLGEKQWQALLKRIDKHAAREATRQGRIIQSLDK